MARGTASAQLASPTSNRDGADSLFCSLLDGRTALAASCAWNGHGSGDEGADWADDRARDLSPPEAGRFCPASRAEILPGRDDTPAAPRASSCRHPTAVRLGRPTAASGALPICRQRIATSLLADPAKDCLRSWLCPGNQSPEPAPTISNSSREGRGSRPSRLARRYERTERAARGSSHLKRTGLRPVHALSFRHECRGSRAF